MLNLLAFNDMVQRFASQARATAGTALDFTIGSLFRAIAEAQAAVGLWMQWLILEVLARTRFATSLGPDADTWGADFGFTRLPAVAAAGSVTFSRNAVGLAAFIPVGATVRTTDGTQSFIVGTDTTNAAWNGSTGYTVGASTASATLPVLALAAGAAGNIQASTVTVLTSAIPGIDTVTNAAPFISGANAETDAAYKARFPLFIAALSRGTVGAISYAVASLQQGLTYSVTENTQTDGTYRPGFFLVTVDDGTGAPSTALLNRAAAAVEAVRPVGTAYAVQGPIVLTANIGMTITGAPGYSHTALIGQVQAALLVYVNSLGIAAALDYSALGWIARNVAGVANAQSILLNGAQADIGGLPSQIVRATTATVVVS